MIEEGSKFLFYASGNNEIVSSSAYSIYRKVGVAGGRWTGKNHKIAEKSDIGCDGRHNQYH